MGSEKESPLRITDIPFFIYKHLQAVVIDLYQVTGKKAIPDDPVDLFTIDAAQDIIIAHLHGDAVQGKAWQVKDLPIQQPLRAYSADAMDEHIAGMRGQVELDGRGGVERNPSATRVEN